ncbi:MAG: hypothetical protein AAF346_17640, partial [Pseudomonadota bacterium]
EAYNLSHASENKIHDDTIAQQLGFTGGLVPGVEVFAYATNPAVMMWGPAFLESGRMQCRFAKPVYDGRIAEVVARPTGEGTLDITVESDGVLSATGQAQMPAARPTAPNPGDYAASLPPAERPPANETSLAVGTNLGIAPEKLTGEVADQYLADVRETAVIYKELHVAHPGWLLRLCNLALKDNVLLPPWIHVGSDMQFFSQAKVGETLSVRSVVSDNYERKGHRFVDMDCLILANDTRPVANVKHTAIYQLRHMAQT